MNKFLRHLPAVALLAAAGLFTNPVLAGECTVTIVAPASIQAAVNASVEGDIICLEDGPAGEVFADQEIFIGNDSSSLTIRATEGKTATLDGSGLANPKAFLLFNTSDVTIEGLEISSYNRGISVGNKTSNIIIRDNVFTATRAAIAAIGIPNFAHTGWQISDNDITGANIGVEVRHCSGCSVLQNHISTTRVGILVSVTNNSSLDAAAVRGISIKENEIEAITFGIVVNVSTLSGDVLMSAVSIVGNSILAQLPFQTQNFASPGAISTLENVSLVRNTLTCSVASSQGVRIVTLTALGTAVTRRIKIIKNIFSGCATNLVESGLDADVMIPPGLEDFVF